MTVTCKKARVKAAAAVAPGGLDCVRRYTPCHHADPEPAPRPPPPVLDYQKPPPAATWTTLMNCPNTVEANLAVTTLQAHGMHARVDMENAAGISPFGGVICGTKVQVLAGEFEAARAIMDDVQRRRDKRHAAETVPCPMCGAAPAGRTVHPIRKVAWLCFAAVVAVPVAFEALDLHPSVWWILLPLLPAFALLVWCVTPRWRCRECGHRWSQPDPAAADHDDDDQDDVTDEVTTTASRR